MHFDATFWVAAGFVVFVGLMLYYKVHRTIIDVLNARAKKIRSDLDEARQLREEAQALLATYERKQRDALKEAEAIMAHAREEAQRETEQARQRLDDGIRRREQLALEKIALAEAQAQKEVRDAAVEIAIAAAEEVIARRISGERGAALVDHSIRDLRRHLM